MRTREKDYDAISNGYKTLLRMLDVMGFVYNERKLSDEDIELYNEWLNEKAAKNFARADEIRDVLKGKGII